MATNKKQTAVEWLVGQITYSNEYGVVRSSFDEMADLSEFIDQAKQMEREQIEEDFSQGMNNSLDYFIPNSFKSESQQYYEQTYGKET